MERKFSTTKAIIKRAFSLSAGLAILTSFTGCKQFILLSYLIFGPPSIEPAFDAATGHQLTEYGVEVAVVVYAEDSLKWEFTRVDDQIAKLVTQRLQSHQITCKDPVSVRAWLDQNPDWDKPQDIGAGLGVTHVIYIDLLDYGLYEVNSPSSLYRGRAEANISVFEMDEDKESGTGIYTDKLRSQYPLHTAISTGEVSFDSFKARYLMRLSEEVGRIFYEHYAGDDIPDGA